MSSIVRKAKYKRVHLNFICESGWHRFQSAAASAGFLDVLPHVWASSTGKFHGGGVLWLSSIHFYTNIGQIGTNKKKGLYEVSGVLGLNLDSLLTDFAPVILISPLSSVGLFLQADFSLSHRSAFSCSFICLPLLV